VPSHALLRKVGSDSRVRVQSGATACASQCRAPRDPESAHCGQRRLKRPPEGIVHAIAHRGGGRSERGDG